MIESMVQELQAIRALLILQLLTSGIPMHQIALALGTNEKSLNRWFKRRRKP